MYPAGGAVENRFGSSGRPTPTLHSTIELRRGRRPRRPVRISYQVLRRASHGFAVPAPFRQGGRGNGDADCHTSDIGHWFAMTGFFHELRCKSGWRGEGTPPHNHTLCRAGPVCPAGGAVENRFGSSGRPTPTLHSTIELRRGRRPRRPVRISYQVLRRARKNPPVTASPCQPPFLGKGPWGQGNGLPHR